MALVECLACGAMVSESLTSCIKCHGVHLHDARKPCRYCGNPIQAKDVRDLRDVPREFVYSVAPYHPNSPGYNYHPSCIDNAMRLPCPWLCLDCGKDLSAIPNAARKVRRPGDGTFFLECDGCGKQVQLPIHGRCWICDLPVMSHMPAEADHWTQKEGGSAGGRIRYPTGDWVNWYHPECLQRKGLVARPKTAWFKPSHPLVD